MIVRLLCSCQWAASVASLAVTSQGLHRARKVSIGKMTARHAYNIGWLQAPSKGSANHVKENLEPLAPQGLHQQEAMSMQNDSRARFDRRQAGGTNDPRYNTALLALALPQRPPQLQMWTHLADGNVSALPARPPDPAPRFPTWAPY